MQTEHPVTELTTGLDMVKLQLHVAGGGLLDGEPPSTAGHAVQARVSAVDPDDGFAPTPGRIDLLRLPTGPGLQVDAGVEEGDEIVPEFAPMIAKLTASGAERSGALARLRCAVDDLSAVVVDGTTDKAYQRWVLAQPEVSAGTTDLGWLEREQADLETIPVAHADVALAAAAIEAHGEQMAAERRQFQSSAVRGRPEVDTTVGRTVNLRVDGAAYRCDVFRLAPNAYRVLVDDQSIVLRCERLGSAELRIEIRGRSYRVLTSVHGVTHVLDVDGHAHHITHDEGGLVRSPAPAVVVSIDVSTGDEVHVGDQLAVIETMKLETPITAAFDGVVEEILVPQKSQVPAGTALLAVRPSAVAAPLNGSRIDFGSIAAPGQFAHGNCGHYLDAIRQELLGFDVDPSVLKAMANQGTTPCPDELADDRQWAVERELLGIFADVIALFRRDPDDVTEDQAEVARRASEESLFDYLRRPELRGRGLPERFLLQLRRTLRHFGVEDLEPSSDLDVALYRLVVSHQRMDTQIAPVRRILESQLRRHTEPDDDLRHLLDRLIEESRGRYPSVHDLADELRFQTFDEPMLSRLQTTVLETANADIDALAADPTGPDRDAPIASLTDCPRPLQPTLSARMLDADLDLQAALLEVTTRRYYRIRAIDRATAGSVAGRPLVDADYQQGDDHIRLITTYCRADEFAATIAELRSVVEAASAEPGVDDVVLDVYLGRVDGVDDPAKAEVAEILGAELGSFAVRRIVVAMSVPEPGGIMHATFRPDDGGYREEVNLGGLHPMMAKRLDLWRLDEFDVNRLPSPDDLYVYHGPARENARDERVFVLAEVRDLTPVLDDDGRVVRLPEAERMVHEAFGALRRFQAQRATAKRLQSNRVLLFVWPPFELPVDELTEIVERLTPHAEGLGIQRVEILVRLGDADGPWQMLAITNPSRAEAQLSVVERPTEVIRPLQPYELNVVRLRQRGLVHPYELIRSLTPEHGSDAGVPPGEFTEYDFVDGTFQAVNRPPGGNTANIVAGVITNHTTRYLDGVTRVILVGDPSRGMGNLAEPECSRINAAIDLAEELGVPLEWFAVSAGAKIAMESGTENMDWISAVLRRIIEFTQGGGEINIVVTGINVGAQPYWNAEATMLMHTRGILIMTPVGAMVLTGKQALDYSGGVSAEDNLGIGGYDRIMGPNGQAQYWAADLEEACQILLQHYDHSYRLNGEYCPRKGVSTDPVDRDITDYPYGNGAAGEFATIGEVFSDEHNPGRKRPFEMRRIMHAVVDQDHEPLERWSAMRDAEIGIVWDAHLGGRPVCIIGMESRPLSRTGLVPADGPDHWTAGTLFPGSSRKVARAINAASGNRPLVVLANLSGFDGSPESMREWQLEYGAEIGRAVVNFEGPVVFCVVSRYHGGAFVVFSKALNDNMQVAALDGAYASVIGGAPAAAVVFARDVRQAATADPRIVAMNEELKTADSAERARLHTEFDQLLKQVQIEKRAEFADKFDTVHSVQRAMDVGSIDAVIAPSALRQYLIEAVERGINREIAATSLARPDDAIAS